jgi:hypothetical protein
MQLRGAAGRGPGAERFHFVARTPFERIAATIARYEEHGRRDRMPMKWPSSRASPGYRGRVVLAELLLGWRGVEAG